MRDHRPRRRTRERVRALASVLGAAMLAATGCKIERVGEVDWEDRVSLPSRLESLPAIPHADASEESLESVVRDELARLRGAADPLEAVQVRMQELGLTPAGRAGGWYFPVDVERVATVSAELELAQSTTDGSAGAAKTHEIVGAHVRRRKAGTWSQSLPLVSVGYGLRESQSGWDDYRGVSVAGAVAVVDWGAPPEFVLAATWSDQELVDHKLQAALDAGAAGCIIRVPALEMKTAVELMPLMVDTARERDEPPKPTLEFEALVSEVEEVLPGSTLNAKVEARAEWATYRLLLARVVGAQQAERNVTLVVEPDPGERELAVYEASSVTALARQLGGYAKRGVKLRRSVTLALLPLGAPVDEMARALLEYGPLPPQNMSSAVVLRDFVGAAASHKVGVFGDEASTLSDRVREVGLPLGWNFSPAEGEDGQRAFLENRVPALSLARTGDVVPADAAHWAESLVAETRLLLRLVLRLAREAEPVRLNDARPIAGSTSADTSAQGPTGEVESPSGSDAGDDTSRGASGGEAALKDDAPTP